MISLESLTLDCYFIPAFDNTSRIIIEPQANLAAQIQLKMGQLDKALDIIEDEIDEPGVEADIKWGSKYQVR